MKIKCGWAEFLDADRHRVIARGSVSAYAVPGPTQGPWDGEVRLLRGQNLLEASPETLWLLRFEHGLECRWVEVRSLDRVWAPSGLRATAHITSFDYELPPYVSELGGE